MKTKYTTILALLAGFLGGFASHYLAPTRTYAQVQGSSPASASPLTSASPMPEIRAEKFVLVDGQGRARGVLGIEKNGEPVIEIADLKNHVFVSEWKVYAGPFFRQPPHGPVHPTLLPEKPLRPNSN